MDTVLEGLSVSQQIHEAAELTKTPVIMVTSIASSEYASMFPTDEYIHVDAFLTKPVPGQGTPAGRSTGFSRRPSRPDHRIKARDLPAGR